MRIYRDIKNNNTSRVNARGDRVMESKACRDHGVYDAFGTCVFFLLVLRLRLEIVKYEPRHCTFCTGVYRATVLLVDIGANLFNMASSFICLSGPVLVGGNIIRAAAIVIKYIEWAERV